MRIVTECNCTLCFVFADNPHMLTYIGPDRYLGAVHATVDYLMSAFFAVPTNITKEDCSSSAQDDWVYYTC